MDFILLMLKIVLRPIIKIIGILKDKSHITIDLQGKQTVSPVKFYKMVIDKQHFGQVKPKEIRQNTYK